MPYTYVYGRALRSGLTSQDLRWAGFNKVMNILSAAAPPDPGRSGGARDATQADIERFKRS